MIVKIFTYLPPWSWKGCRKFTAHISVYKIPVREDDRTCEWKIPTAIRQNQTCYQSIFPCSDTDYLSYASSKKKDRYYVYAKVNSRKSEWKRSRVFAFFSHSTINICFYHPLIFQCCSPSASTLTTVLFRRASISGFHYSLEAKNRFLITFMH